MVYFTSGDLVFHLSCTCEPIHRLDCLPLISRFSMARCNHRQGTSLNQCIEIENTRQLPKMTRNKQYFYGNKKKIVIFFGTKIFGPGPFSVTKSGNKHNFNFGLTTFGQIQDGVIQILIWAFFFFFNRKISTMFGQIQIGAK